MVACEGVTCMIVQNSAMLAVLYTFHHVILFS